MLKKLWSRFWDGANYGNTIIIKIMNVVIILLIFFLLIFVKLICDECLGVNDIGHDVEYYIYQIQYEDYTGMVEDYYKNIADFESESDWVKEYYYVAQYAEAAAYYNAFSETGDEKRAKQYAGKMEVAEASMGSLYSEIDVIKRKLGLDK